MLIFRRHGWDIDKPFAGHQAAQVSKVSIEQQGLIPRICEA